jgi:hypothetical protein
VRQAFDENMPGPKIAELLGVSLPRHLKSATAGADEKG